jgi:hypothetical protein
MIMGRQTTTATRQEQRLWSWLAASIHSPPTPFHSPSTPLPLPFHSPSTPRPLPVHSPSTPRPLPCVTILRCHLLVFLGGLIGGAELGANLH